MGSVRSRLFLHYVSLDIWMRAYWWKMPRMSVDVRQLNRFVALAAIVSVVGCASVPPPGELVAGLVCEALSPLVPELSTPETAPPLAEPIDGHGPYHAEERAVMTPSKTLVARDQLEPPRDSHLPHSNPLSVSRMPTVPQGSAVSSEVVVRPLSGPAIHEVGRQSVEPVPSPGTPSSAPLEASEDHGACLQLEGLRREYRNFHYEDVVRHAEVFLADGVGNVGQRAQACILAGAASYILGQLSQAESYMSQAAALNSSLAPDPSVFPTAVCELHRAASARSGL